MNDLFIQASRKAFRYPSTRGEITTEQLWHLPLLGKNGNAGFDLDMVARTINNIVKELSEGSFVETRANPQQAEMEAKLEVVKFVIATKQEEAKAAELRVARAEKRRKILDALDARDSEELTKASREELLAKLSELDG
jgi:DNA-binding MarR family transcriptional regulator